MSGAVVGDSSQPTRGFTVGCGAKYSETFSVGSGTDASVSKAKILFKRKEVKTRKSRNIILFFANISKAIAFLDQGVDFAKLEKIRSKEKGNNH